MKSVDRQDLQLTSTIQFYWSDGRTFVECFFYRKGTQAIGLSEYKHHDTASDLSPNELQRAKQEAERHGQMNISFSVCDLTTIKSSKDLFRPLPTYLYNDSSVYQLERENIFAKNWIYAGRLDRLQKLGDYLSITIAGYPIFIYRSPLTNKLIAFHNVCSHRAGPIVPINTNNHGVALYGNQSLLKCQYHAWLFDSRDGSLKATPN
ncbi:unnamed protein product, partial [Adineta ricciae]